MNDQCSNLEQPDPSQQVPTVTTDTSEVRKAYEMYRGQSHGANAVLSMCDEIDGLRTQLTAALAEIDRLKKPKIKEWLWYNLRNPTFLDVDVFGYIFVGNKHRVILIRWDALPSIWATRWTTTGLTSPAPPKEKE